ncbi:MAG: neutral zinc metallopeptidase, partial [Mycobacteriaceae bacterium]
LLQHDQRQGDVDLLQSGHGRRVTGDDLDQLATNAVADIQKYWQETYPKLFNEPFEPVKKLVSYDSTDRSSRAKICGRSTAGLINAFYCPSGDLIAWDRGALLPEIADHFTTMGVVNVLAHEYGHTIQQRAKLNNSSTPDIVFEQQADCFGGAFMRWVAEGHAPHFDLNTSNGLNTVLASTVAVRDKTGTDPSKDDAHGSAFDRVSAFQFGFSDGPGRCVEITPAEVNKRLQRLPSQFTNRGDTGELPITEKTITAVVSSLNDSFQGNNVSKPTVTFDGSGTCTDAKATPPVSYCPGSNILTVDTAGLAARAKKPPSDGNSALPSSISGDFSAFVLLASRYTLSVQKGLGAGLTGALVGLRSACYAGGYAAATTSQNSSLQLSPGDLDEAVSGLLTDGLAASDVNGVEAPSGFTRVQAFRTGVLDGAGACAAVYS